MILIRFLSFKMCFFLLRLLSDTVSVRPLPFFLSLSIQLTLHRLMSTDSIRKKYSLRPTEWVFSVWVKFTSRICFGLEFNFNKKNEHKKKKKNKREKNVSVSCRCAIKIAIATTAAAAARNKFNVRFVLEIEKNERHSASNTLHTHQAPLLAD